MIISPVFIYFLLMIPYVQNKAGGFITSNLSKTLGTEVSISAVHFYPFKKLVVDDFLIKDQNNDTLIFSKKISAHIDSIQLQKKIVFLGEVKAEKLYANFKQYNDSNNFKFLIDSISGSKKKSSNVWTSQINQLALNQSLVKIAQKQHKITPGIFNPNDIELSRVNLHIDKINLLNDSLAFRIKNLSLRDKCGFKIKNLESFVYIGQHSSIFNNLKIRSEYSSLSVEHFQFKYDSIDALNNFAYEVPLELDIKSFLIDLNDLRKFSNRLPNIKNRIYLNGYLKGTLNNLKGRNVKINAGTNTEILTNFDISEIFNPKESYLYLNVKHLKTNTTDLGRLISLNKGSKDFEFPKSFQKMGNINFKGIISGFVDNLVTYGSFHTEIGTIITDIGFKFTEDKKFIYSGFLNTKSLNLGKLIKSENNLNKVTMDVSINGYRTNNKNFYSYIKGTVDSIEYNNYKYQQIKLNGLISNNKFDGKFQLNDPNAHVLFEGKMDFRNSVPEFDFDASLHNVNLNKLNLTKKLEGCSFDINISSELSGKDMNSVNGEINLLNGIFVTQNKIIPIDTFKIKAENLHDHNALFIQSDLFDGEIKGTYHLKTLYKTLKNEFSKYLPAISPHQDINDNYPSDFNFYFKTNRFAELLQELNTGFNIADSSILMGNFNHSEDDFSLYAESDSITFNNLYTKDLSVQIETKNNKLFTDLKSKEISYNKMIPIQNLTLLQQIENNIMTTDLGWINSNKPTNKGNILTKTTFKRSNKDEIYAQVKLLPTDIITNDSIWHIQESSITINSFGVGFDVFRIAHLNQEISINGSLYKKADNELNAYFQNINLDKITSLLNLKNLSFGGIINGSIKITGEMESPIVTNNLNIKNMSINEAVIGDLQMDSYWDKKENAILVSAIAKNKDLTPLEGNGYYFPKSNDYNFYFDLDSMPINFLDYYLNKVVQDIDGNASGKINLSNSYNNKFTITGKVKLNNSDFNINLLHSSFTLQDSVFFTPTEMIFKNMTVTDTNGKSGKFNGTIQHNSFKDFKYDLYARANNMLIMNTINKDNPLYYGTVYGTGDLAISGTTYDLYMDITGKTERKTKFYIPITEKTESLNHNFIRFIDYNKTDTKSSSTTNTYEDYHVNLSNLAINMSIEVTPEAEIQVIFDPAVGDVLRSWGSGNIQIQLSKEGDVIFYGDYTAEKGDYLFSLENVVNKRFDINKGGKVVWEGDPYDAVIDLTASYKLKTSIQPLILSESSDATYRRIPIYCDMILSGHLSQPNIRFNISAPTMEQSTQTLIDDAINTEEELNRQVLSLLILNKFYTPDYYANNSGERQVNSAALTNTSEMLSSQLSNWLSQISNDFDIGISYRPENDISSEQLEVALSTQIFNDRVTIDGNVEYGKYNTTDQNTNNIVGDFDLNVKLNKSGNLRAKAYTHTNDDYSYNSSLTTQGVGISYQEEFDTVGELIRKYWRIITGKGKKEKEVEVEQEIEIEQEE